MILGLDIGTKRTGVAISSTDFAREYTTLATDNNLADRLAEICQAEKIQQIVVGLPLHEDGSASTQSDWVKQLVTELGATVPAQFIFVDELLTTVEARRQLQNMAVKPEAIEARVDQYAAQLILQQYLNEHPDPTETQGRNSE